MDTAIIDRLDKIDRDNKRILAMLAGQRKKSTWVSAVDIMKLTGWTKDEMFRMRRSRVVEFKKVGKTITYNLDTLPQIFVKSK